MGRELTTLASIQSAQGDLAGAIVTRREALAAIRNQTGKAHSRVIGPLTELASDLTLHGDFAEAEGLLIEAWKMEQSLNYFRIVPQRGLRESFAKLYTAWAKIDSSKSPLVDEWQRKLDELNRAAAKEQPVK